MDTGTPPLLGADLYERDLQAWCERQAALLHGMIEPGNRTEIDYANLAEGIEALGRS